jgi:peptidoglycan-associated lipoprotein
MNISKVLGASVSATVVSLALVACGGSKPPVNPPSNTASTGNTGPTAQNTNQAPSTSNVSISDEIRTKCGIPDADAYFTFDSSHVTGKDHSPLDLVAKCFINGPLAGHAVKLVGRADPRGESDYNITLGQSRADAVGLYLDARGMTKGKTLSSSRGAMDATGTDESGWQKDRRVDVMLGD